MLDQTLTTRSKVIADTQRQLFLLKSIATQVSRFNCNLTHLASVTIQLIPPATISPSATTPLGIKPMTLTLISTIESNVYH